MRRDVKDVESEVADMRAKGVVFLVATRGRGLASSGPSRKRNWRIVASLAAAATLRLGADVAQG
jgi:hypothetical protein